MIYYADLTGDLGLGGGLRGREGVVPYVREQKLVLLSSSQVNDFS
jgi:hypothetical protein